MTDATPYTVPKEPGRWRALTLAALVHAALLAFFWIGIRWQSETPATIEAEVWSPQPREAAPRPELPKEPIKEPEVKEIPKPRAVEPPPIQRDIKPDIALEQEKKRKAEQEKKKRQEEEQRLALDKEKKRLDEERLAQLKLKQQQDEKRLEKEKADKAKKAAEEKAEKEKEKKLAAEKKRKQDEADEKLLAKARDDEMRRITGGVTGTGGAGDAPKSQGGRVDGGYAARVAAKIKSNINFNVPDGMDGNPAVEYEVNLLPDGSVAGIRRVKSSGIPGFDEAVRRAIEKSQPYPKDKSGAVPSSFTGIHKPKDQ
jgi:colicin import membrane protein